VTSLSAWLGALITERNPATAGWFDLAERAVVDTAAVLLAGADDPAVRIVAETVEDSDGAVLSLATGRRMGARSAALVDGTSAHALDYDDVDDSLIAHPSAVLVPALLAAAQHRGNSGEAVLRAYRVGLEAARAVGKALDIPRHYGAGWHSTSTVGTLGAAAAVSALLSLDARKALHALGVAGSLACGSRQNFGTMTKPLHAGIAASNGVTAAYLAERGFTADPGQLEGPLGFLALHRAPARDGDLDLHIDHEAAVGLNLKLYPCCYATHAAIEAATRLRTMFESGTGFAAIEVAVPPGGLAPLIHHRPTDGTQAKFSMQYAVAAALLDGSPTLASFRDERVRRPDVQQLLRKVTVTDRPSPQLTANSSWFATVTVHSVTDRTRTVQIDNPIGHCSRPLSERQLRDKFRDCLSPAGQPAADRAFASLRNLRARSSMAAVVTEVLAAARATAGAPS
jgi:2-methylcitrate dehydratase PrpD